MNLYVSKGARVRVRWFDVDPKASLAGMQTKFSTTEREVVGVVKRIRGDRPVDPQEAVLFVVPDGETDEIQVRPECIVEVLS